MPHSESFIGYAPRGGGLLCAITYIDVGDDIAGWFVGLKDYNYPSAYFQVESFYSPDNKRFFASAGSDLYGGWRFDYGRSDPNLTPAIRADDALCHRLDKLQDAFVGEWLVYREQAAFAAEEALYLAEELPVGDVLINHARLAKFDRLGPVWKHYSHGFNDEVLGYLAPRWPLDYGKS